MDEQAERRVLQKVRYVMEAVSILAEKRDSLSRDEYRSQREQRDVVEREFETAIEACIDVGRVVLVAQGGDVPSTNADVFRRLGERGVLDKSTARQMAEAAGFRNILSHRYGDEIDDEDVYNFLQYGLPVFHAYLEQIRAEL